MHISTSAVPVHETPAGVGSGPCRWQLQPSASSEYASALRIPLPLKVVVNFVAGATVALVLGACTRTLSVEPGSPTGSTAEGGISGSGAATINQVVVRLLTPKFASRLDALPEFYVAVQNKGNLPFAFSAKYITAYSGNTPVKVYDRQTLFARIASETEIRETVAGDSVTGVGSSDPEDVRNIRAFDRDQVQALRFMLPEGTVGPGKSVDGIIELDADNIRSGAPLRLLVDAGGEMREFRFRVGR
jgi:hypothetical protein